jgi:hypothetical protein
VGWAYPLTSIQPAASKLTSLSETGMATLELIGCGHILAHIPTQR